MKTVTTPKESENKVDEQIERLRVVVMEFNRMSDEEQKRVFEFLKSKYSKSWPYEG